MYPEACRDANTCFIHCIRFTFMLSTTTFSFTSNLGNTAAHIDETKREKREKETMHVLYYVRNESEYCPQGSRY